MTLGGKDFYLGRWQSEASKAEYDRLTGEWMANGRRVVAPEAPRCLPMIELLAAYLAFAQGYYGRYALRRAMPLLVELDSDAGSEPLHRDR